MKSFKHYSIKNKLVVFTMSATLFALIFMMMAINTIDQIITQKSMVKELSALSEVLAARSSAAVTFNSAREAQVNVDAFSKSNEYTMACLYNEVDQKLSVLASYSMNQSIGQCPVDPKNFIASSGSITKEYIHVLTDVEVPKGHGEFYLRRSMESMNTRLSTFTYASLAISSLVLLLIYAIISWVHGIITKPIIALSKISDEIADNNDYTLRADVRSQDELGSLSKAFNTMLEKIGHAQKELTEMAFNDALTGLPNRRFFMESLERQMNLVARGQKSVSLFLIDLDGFKSINDTIGHDAGDWVLTTVSDRMQTSLRKGDLVARLGGDEFTIILENVSEPLVLRRIAMDVIRSIEEPIDFKGQPANVSASIGIAMAPKDAKEIDALLKNADSAMYHAKESGKNTFFFFNEDDDHRAKRFQQMEDKIQSHLNNNQLAISFRSVINLKTKELIALQTNLYDAEDQLIPQQALKAIANHMLACQLSQYILESIKESFEKMPQPTTLLIYISCAFLETPGSFDLVNETVQTLKAQNIKLLICVEHAWLRRFEANNNTANHSFIPTDSGNALDLLTLMESPLEDHNNTLCIAPFPDEPMTEWHHQAWQHLVNCTFKLNYTFIIKNIDTPEQLVLAKQIGIRYGTGKAIGQGMTAVEIKDYVNQGVA